MESLQVDQDSSTDKKKNAIQKFNDIFPENEYSRNRKNPHKNIMKGQREKEEKEIGSRRRDRKAAERADKRDEHQAREQEFKPEDLSEEELRRNEDQQEQEAREQERQQNELRRKGAEEAREEKPQSQGYLQSLISGGKNLLQRGYQTLNTGYRTFNEYQQKREEIRKKKEEELNELKRKAAEEARKQRGSMVADPDSEDPYKVLGIPRDATKEEIKAAYRKTSFAYHPDKYFDRNDEEAIKKKTEQFQNINNAHADLINKK